ncbi:MAG: class I SAM-dependent methyltransferase [Polyangiales bacterium]
MRGDRPSLTAAFVAIARGVGTARDVLDPVARDMLPWPVGPMVHAAGRGRMLRPGLRAASLGLVDHITLRMEAIDQAVRDAVAAGAGQLVLLGAGLDGRAWRMPELGDVAVFEVDHPATQAYKRARVEGRAPLAREVSFVPVDFERERLADALEAAGHDRTVPSVWVWEGVTMYLQRTAVVSTLGQIQSRSAAGSRLALSYAVPELLPVGGDAARRAAETFFRALGEPLVGAMPPKEIASLLAGAAFHIESDTDSSDWAARHRATAPLASLFRAERLAVAVRHGG